MSWKWSTLLPVFVLIACSAEESPPRQQDSTLPVERTQLVLAVSRSADAVQAAGAAWAAKEGVDLAVVAVDDPQANSASLVETRGPGAEAWLLEPRGLLVRLDALESLGRGASPPASWAELSGLVVDLARQGGGLGLPSEAENLHEILLPLIWSTQPDSVATAPGSSLRAPEAEEALAFLVQLSQHALRLPSSEIDEAFLSGQIAVLPCELQQARRLQGSMPSLRSSFWPWPAAPERGASRAFAVLYSLAVPQGGAHADLASSLARELASTSSARAVAKAGVASIPAAFGKEERSTLMAAHFWDALRPWPLDASEELEAELLDEACDAALDLRRSPGAALAESRQGLER